MLLEVTSGDRGVFALVVEGAAELLDLVGGKPCLQSFEALGELSLCKATGLGLGLLVSPLREEALVGQALLEDNGVNLDASLEEPVLVALDKDSLLELLVIKPRQRGRDFLLLGLHVSSLCLLGALLTDALKQLEQLFLSELQPHGLCAVMDEVLLLNGAVVLGVQDFVALVN